MLRTNRIKMHTLSATVGLLLIAGGGLGLTQSGTPESVNRRISGTAASCTRFIRSIKIMDQDIETWLQCLSEK